MPAEIPITPEGLAHIREELHELTTVRRPDIIDKIKRARELGDLSENFEYHAAKNEQGIIEGRVRELEAIVMNHVLIDTAPSTEFVALGTHVTIAEDGAPDETYHIVGPAEADPGAGRISLESPLGQSLKGRRPGDEVTVDGPSGSYSVRIVSIK